MVDNWISGLQLLNSSAIDTGQRHLFASTSCSAMDKVLDNGFHYGEITSIAGIPQSGKSLIALHAIAAHLLQAKDAQVVFIDSTGSFSALKLKNIVSSVRKQSPCSVSEAQTENEAEQLMQCLNRVKIMRVFDLTGASDSVQEVSGLWDSSVERPSVVASARSGCDGEIRSSQDEEEDLTLAAVNNDDSRTDSEIDKASRMIVVDHISNLVGRELSQNQTEGQSRFSVFHRQLRKLTVQANVATILINQAGKAYQDPMSNPSKHQPLDAGTSQLRPVMPGLGRSYLQAIDLSVLLLPILSSKNGVTVVEVLSDRFGDRSGRHGTFRVWRQQLLPVS